MDGPLGGGHRRTSGSTVVMADASGLSVRSHAGLPREAWNGRAVLPLRRSAWFEGPGGLIGLMERGLSPSPAGMELAGSLPRIRLGARLSFDGTQWCLEGSGVLEGAPTSHNASAVLGYASPDIEPSGDWAACWRRWLDGHLPSDEEGLWLRNLLNHWPKDWETLVGRGSGSTPSGDDVLAGWSAAQMWRGQWSVRDGERLATVLSRTGRLSRHFLGHLLQRRVDPSLADFLSTQPLPWPESGPAQALVVHGDLSGRALLVGLVAALSSGV